MRVNDLHERDLGEGFGTVYLPYVLERRYPDAHKQRAWKVVFSSVTHLHDPRSGIEWRHHVSVTVLQRAVKEAVKRTSLQKPISPYTLRRALLHSSSIQNMTVRTVQVPLSATKMPVRPRSSVYSTKEGPGGLYSPLDTLDLTHLPDAARNAPP